jgi:hypothetical protein
MGWAQTPGSSVVEPAGRPAQAEEVVPMLSSPSVDARRAGGGHPGVWNDRIKPWLQRTHWGYADEFHPMTFGASVNEHFRTQICNGLGSQLVLYAYDFRDDSGPEASLLNSHGQRQLDRIARMVEGTGLHPIGIEASGNAAVDAARRQEVIRQLSAAHGTIPAEWVVVGFPTAIGLRGAEAVEIYKNLLNNTKSRGSAGIPKAAGGPESSAAGMSGGAQQ